ncbi:hypothetical protein Pst134EA_025789 [Puccinia striiformis f. sp. tritici]|uniref:hypothetical protein n=1 Tax=Puccinia striiformis f. sp. tritici TaxID=168172 RepID=UPI002008C969|nr:hypothetical protein Pst134EA_025789 [Puccinia striiformis f. sp. tritici]KAH9451850.1 hypothetical protein Pst134EA_025789 [Puccinia striiformis f. sp. tritici]
MFARLSILVLLLTANLSSASPSSIGNAYQNMPATRSSSPLKRTTRTAFANNRANSTRVARSLPLLPLLGQILPVTANLKVDICLDLSVKVLGIATVNVFATAALAASITSQGISVDELAVVQASLASELAGVARVSTTSYACEQACTSDGTFLGSHHFYSACQLLIKNAPNQSAAATISIEFPILAHLHPNN